MSGLFTRILNRLTRRQFEAASGRRFDRPPPFGRIGAETLAATGRVRDRARHARANDPYAANAVSTYETGLIGTGITFASDHPDPEARKLLDAEFAGWAASNSFPALQAEIVQALVTDGEALVVMRVGPAGLELRHVPIEQLDDGLTMDLGDGRYIVGGVEYGSDDRPAAYHISSAKPTDQFASYLPPVRVDAADVLHVFKPIGAGQSRGMSWFAPVLLPLNELSQLHDALLVSAKIQAMHVAFMTDTLGNATGNPYAEGTRDGDNLNVSLEPGTVRLLPPGWDIKFSNPAQLAQSIEFAALSIRTIAAGLQIPEFLLSGDMRGANYSSMRSALVQFRQHLEAIQHLILVPQLLLPIWKRWLTLAVLSGQLDLADFEERQADYFAVEFYPPAMPWVDPAKDADATATMIAAGLKSRRQAVAELGYSVENLDREIASDRERETALGLAFGPREAPIKEQIVEEHAHAA